MSCSPPLQVDRTFAFASGDTGPPGETVAAGNLLETLGDGPQMNPNIRTLKFFFQLERNSSFKCLNLRQTAGGNSGGFLKITVPAGVQEKDIQVLWELGATGGTDTDDIFGESSCQILYMWLLIGRTFSALALGLGMNSVISINGQ